MSLDKSLRTSASLERHRNVLSRNERIGVLKEEGRFEDGRKPLGLPKVAHRKANVGGKAKKEKKAEEGAEGTPAAAAAAPAAGAAAAKGAAPKGGAAKK